jgi:hypothetical protein
MARSDFKLKSISGSISAILITKMPLKIKGLICRGADRTKVELVKDLLLLSKVIG